MCFEPSHGGLRRRPTAIGVAPQDLGQRCRAARQGVAVSKRPSVQPFRHDLDPASDTQILDAQFAQRDIEVAEHGIEEGLRQPFAVGLSAQTVYGKGGMQGQRIEAAIESVGNAAGIEQFRQTRVFGSLGIKGSGKLVFGTLTAEHDPAPYGPASCGDR